MFPAAGHQGAGEEDVRLSAFWNIGLKSKKVC